MPFADFQAAPLFYQAHKHGRPDRPPLALVHGAGGDHLHWPPQVRHLSGATVYALDLPGHGRSAGAASSAIIEKAEAVIALLDQLGIDRAVVGGHSMGGAIALTLALTCPERVAGLVLVSTGAKLRVAPQILEGLASDFARTVDLIVEWEFGSAAPANVKRLARQWMLASDLQVLRGDWEACNVFDIREQLGAITAPALVACGTDDRMTPEKFSRFLAETLPGAELRLFPGAGHMLPLEQPQALAQAMAGFLARI